MRYLVAFLALSLAVAVHEWGHLVGARLLRLTVRRFTLGFGPPLVSLVRGRTRYSLGAIPFGASVEVHGLNPHEPLASAVEAASGDAAEDAAGARARRPGVRALVVLAGPLANVLVAVAALAVLYLSGTHVLVPMTVGTVEPGSAAARAGVRPGDKVLRVDGAPVEEWTQLVERVAQAGDRPLELGLLRGGEPQLVRVQPRVHARGEGRLGITQQYVFRRLPPLEALGRATVHAAHLTGEGLQLLWGLARGEGGVPQLTAPVSAAKQAADSAGTGADAFLRVFVGFSLVLALLHLLPLPALDGGRLVLALLAARGRKVPARVETTLHALGFLLLVGLIGWLAAGELRRLRSVPAPTLSPVARPASAPAPAVAGDTPP